MCISLQPRQAVDPLRFRQTYLQSADMPDDSFEDMRTMLDMAKRRFRKTYDLPTLSYEGEQLYQRRRPKAYVRARK